jgi:anti-sigma factor RsiW
MQCADCRAVLDALIDDELMPAEARAAREHIAACADCARAHQSLAATSQLLREDLVHYSAPDVLKARIHTALHHPNAVSSSAPAPRSTWRRSWLAAAAVAIAISSSGLTFAVVNASTASRSVSDEILASHVRSLMPGHLTDVVSSDQHNVKPWFDGRVNLSPTVPGLDSAGFNLVGGRLDYLDGHSVAVVVYARRQHIINVYSWPSAGRDTPVSSAEEQGYHLDHWRSHGVEVWAVSDVNPSELSRFVDLLQRDDGPSH